MIISDLTEDKKSIRNLLGFSYKMTLLILTGYISSNYSGVDLINYKKNTFVQFLIFMLIEEKINSYLPNWMKGNKKAKFKRAEKMTFAEPINIETGTKLVPAIPSNFKPSKTLSPAHHDL